MFLLKHIQDTLPVFYIARVELKLVIIPQQSLLYMTEIHQLAVDEYEPHTTLERRSKALAVWSSRSTAWMEITHDTTFSFYSQETLG